MMDDMDYRHVGPTMEHHVLGTVLGSFGRDSRSELLVAYPI